MRKPVLCLLSFVFLFASTFLVKAGNPPVTKWTVKNPFEQKVFIENKGQYNLPDKAPSKNILFGAQLDGLNYYFTSTGIWITHYVQVKSNNKESTQLQLPNAKHVQEFHQINFIAANSSAEIIGDNKVKQYYNFRGEGNSNIKASAYQKIIYRNLYPGIDMEFYFPEDKLGFEYSFIVHPGADISQIKMQYPLSERIALTAEGNITIQSTFGEFTDHAPVANQQGLLTPITCSFRLNEGEVDFSAGNYNKNKDLIIDPWTSIPSFPLSRSDRAYDLDWDNAGNCYVYGGSGQYEEYPLYLLKYDNTGKLLWSIPIHDYYSEDYGTELYGDFCVDKNSQSIYISQGANVLHGAEIIKLNRAGAIIDSSGGNINMTAMWRIAFTSQYNELIGAGGAYPNSPAATAMYADTNLTNGTIVYVNTPANPFHYMWGITLDNFGNCYMAISGLTAGDTTGNDMFKLPLSTLSPTSWEVNDGYEFHIFTPGYITENGGNGYNGMTVNDTNLYTYDSYTLKKWATTNGTLLNSINIDGNNGTPSNIYWGGITSDSCGDILLGYLDTVKQYTDNLTLINYIIAHDTIYDLSMGNNNILYACGADFVSAIDVSPPRVIIDSPGTCLGTGVALKPSGGNSYNWFPSAGLNTTTGDSVIANPSVTTTYTIVGFENVSCPDTVQSVVTIKPLPTIIAPPASICYGNSTVLTASGAVSYTWAPATGLNITTGDSVTANPSITTTYTVTGLDTDGCTASVSDIVTVTTSPNKPTFSQHEDTLISSSSRDNQWYRNDSLLVNDTSQDLIITVLGEYLVVVSNEADGCSTSSDSMNISSLTGVNQLSAISGQLSVYPNPFNSTIYVTINPSAQYVNDWSLQITDVLGRIIYSRISLNYSNEINLSKIPSGVYFITVTNEKGRAVFPIIRQE